MRLLRVAVVVGLVAIGVVIPASPAEAAGITVSDRTYTPTMINVFGFEQLKFTMNSIIGGPATFEITIDGQPMSGTQMTAAAPANCVPKVETGQYGRNLTGTPVTVIAYIPTHTMQDAVTTRATATVSVAAHMDGIGDATGHVYVKPIADLAIQELFLSSPDTNQTDLMFGYRNRGPSGSASSTITIGGLHTKPSRSLPDNCAWTGAGIQCGRHSTPRQGDDDGYIVPIAFGDWGCAITVKVAGLYGDPNHADNNQSIHDTRGPCGAGNSGGGNPTTTKPSTPKASSTTPAATPATVGATGTATASTAAAIGSPGPTQPQPTDIQAVASSHSPLKVLYLPIALLLVVGSLLLLRRRRLRAPSAVPEPTTGLDRYSSGD